VRHVFSTALLLAAIVPGAAVGGNPWNLRCPSMQLEQPLPSVLERAARAFSPWIGKNEGGLRAGPIYLVAGSYRTAISRDGDVEDGRGDYLHRVLIAIAPSYSGGVVITGRRLGRAGPRTTLGFSIDGASRCTVRGNDVLCDHRLFRFARTLAIAGRAGWRVVRTELRIGRPGCFEVSATGNRLHVTIPLSVPGPDWPKPGP
jgi:hypothetical protein